MWYQAGTGVLTSQQWRKTADEATDQYADSIITIDGYS